MTQTTPASTGIEEAGHPRRWAILGVLVVSLVVVVLDNTVLNVALKVLADPVDGLGASQSNLAWMINSYTLVFAGLLFAFGVIGDRVGRKRMLLGGLAVFGLASFLSSQAASAEQLIAFRALMGAGAAAMMPATLALIRAVFSAKEFPKALGVWTGAVGIGGAIGPIVGGALLEQFWWGSVFIINVPIVLAGIVAVMILVPESKGVQGRPDLVGMGLSIAGLVALTYGVIEAGDAGSWTGVEVWGTIALGVLILVAFVLWERRVPYASLDIRLFKNPRFSASAAIIALTFFAMLGLMFFMTFYIQIVRGHSPLEAGLLFLPMGIAMILVSPAANAVVGRYGARTVGLAAFTLITAVFVTIATMDVGTPLAVLVALMFVLGVGMSLLMVPAMNTLMSSVPKERAGVASALSNTLRQVGGAFGVAVLGTVMAQAYQARIGDAVPELTESARQSIAATYGALESGTLPGDAVPAIARAANESFVHAMHVTAYYAIGVAVLGAIVIALFFPGRLGTPERAALVEEGARQPD